MRGCAFVMLFYLFAFIIIIICNFSQPLAGLSALTGQNQVNAAYGVLISCAVLDFMFINLQELSYDSTCI